MMPKLTEVQRLFTSDSSDGRVKTKEKRKYHQGSDLTPDSTTAKSRKVEDAATTLLSVSSIVRNKRRHENTTKEVPEEFTRAFVQLPYEFMSADDDLVGNTRDKVMSGNHIVDINNKLDDGILKKSVASIVLVSRSRGTYKISSITPTTK